MHREHALPQRAAESRGDEPANSGVTRQGSLRSNFSWTLTGNLIYSACQWGMLTALVKLGSAQMVGQFALAVAVTTPVFAFANLQLRNIQATDVHSEYRFGHYLGLRSITTTLALLLTVAIALLGGFGWQLGLVFVIAGLGRAFDAFSDVMHGWLQQREDMAPIAISMIVNGVLSLGGLGLGVLLTGNLVYGVLGSAAASALTLLTYLLPAVRHRMGPEIRFRPVLDRIILARLTWLALPMGVVMLLSALDASVPRYVIERQLGQEELGIFAALAYLLTSGTTVVVALGHSVSPRLARYFAGREYGAYIRMLLALGGAGILMGLLGAGLVAVAGQPIVRLLYSEQYADHLSTLTILALAAGVQYAASFAGFGMTAARRFHIQVPLHAAMVLVNLAASLLLIPRLGLSGAALSTAIAALVSLSGGSWAIWLAVKQHREGAPGSADLADNRLGSIAPGVARNAEAMTVMLAPFGPTRELEHLVVEVNQIYHDIEAIAYDQRHPEVHRQLPPKWAEMVTHVVTRSEPGSWSILDFGCGTGFEAEQLLRLLPEGSIRRFVCYDPSPNMLERCRARIGELYPDVETVSSLDALHGARFNLLATNSLLHHLPDPVAAIAGLRPLLDEGAWWIAGHEPSSRYYQNPATLRLLERFENERRWLRFLQPQSYLNRARVLLGLRDDPVRRTAKAVVKAGLFDHRPSLHAIDRLVDFHVAHSLEEARAVRGFEVHELKRALHGSWELCWYTTYSFMGPWYEAALPPRWAGQARELAAVFPDDGANFCAVWRLES